MTHKPQTICALLAPLLLPLAGCLPGPGRAYEYETGREIMTEGLYVHRSSGVQFPETFIPFERVGILEYYETGDSVSVGYNFNSFREPTMLTVWLYPRAGDGPLNPDAVLAEQYEQSLWAILRSRLDCELLSEGAFTLRQNGRTVVGKRAIVRFEEEFVGQQQLCTSCLYLFYDSPWIIKYRVTYPASAYELAQESTERFIRDFPILPKNGWFSSIF